MFTPTVTSVADILRRDPTLLNDETRHRSNRRERTGVDMATTEVDVKYLDSLAAFKNKLSEEQTKGHLKRGSNVEDVAVYVDNGRRFDKVMTSVRRKGKVQPEKLVVVYFVERATGIIYGAKSPLAPNMKWYYGTLATMDQWDWSPERYAIPKDLEAAGVREVGQYADFKHYAPLQKTA